MSCTHHTISHISQLRNKLFIFAIFPPWHQPLESRGMRISIHIHQERRRHKMRSLLSLLIQHVVICIEDQRSVIRMEEHLIWNLREKRFSKEINGHLQLSCCFGTAPIPITTLRISRIVTQRTDSYHKSVLLPRPGAKNSIVKYTNRGE